MMSRQHNTQFMTYGLQVQWAEGGSSEAVVAVVTKDVEGREMLRSDSNIPETL